MPRLEFPVAIGLTGAPSSGKAATAAEFAKIAAPLFEEHGSELHVVENAGEVIQRDFNRAMGVFGEPSDNLWAFFNRHQREQQLRLQSKSLVTVGTPLDHLAHSGICVENLMVGLQTEIQQVRLQRAHVALNELTLLQMENMRYHFAFYLPSAGTSLVIPGADDLEANYNARIDRTLQTIMGNFGLRLQRIDGTPEEKAQTMLDTIVQIIEQGIPGEDPGEDITEPSEPLSDETLEKLADEGIEMTDWQPDLPSGAESTVTE